MRRLTDPAYRHRSAQLLADVALAAAAFYLAFKLRFFDSPGGIPSRYDTMLIQSIAPIALVKGVVFALAGLHRKWWRYFTPADLWPIVRACAVATGLIVIFFALVQPFPEPTPHQLPRSVVILDFLFTVLFLAAGRAAARFVLVERRARAAVSGLRRKVLVVGAGSGGQMVVRELKLNPNLRTQAIGFIDDDPRKRGMVVEGVKVLGSTDEAERILDEVDPDEVVIAIPSAPGTLRAKVVSACRERSIATRTLPTVFELLRGGVQLTRQLREVQVEDVLGREPVVMELDRVGSYLSDRVVMVTGAGGSIGSELCRQIARVRPRLLILLDHAEDNLFEIDREMHQQWHFSSVESVLADCREADRMLEVMQRQRPEVVFHAAAYKHVPLMEANPLEAIRNNALGTRITAETAAAATADRFVLVSTDKAVNPQTVMGASKALAEWIVEAAAVAHPATRFTTVRFGNVLGSSGSVVPIFRSQIEHGGPLTVTDPEMTRFFMTIPEAVQLVIQAGDLGEGTGEVFVLEMGEPVRILDLARNMIRLAGYEPEEIAIEITGARPGEKLHEEFLNPDEVAAPTGAPRILRAVRSTPLDHDWVGALIGDISRLLSHNDETGLSEEIVGMIAARPNL